MSNSIALPLGWETGPLAEELKTYQEHQADLLRQSPGKFALVKGHEIVGLYDKEEEAFSEAYRRFRLSGFMIKQVLEHEKVYTVGGSSFGLLDQEDVDVSH